MTVDIKAFFDTLTLQETLLMLRCAKVECETTLKNIEDKLSSENIRHLELKSSDFIRIAGHIGKAQARLEAIDILIKRLENGETNE